MKRAPLAIAMLVLATAAVRPGARTDAPRHRPVTRLVTELLDISRLETGRLVLRRQLVDLPALASSVVEKLANGGDVVAGGGLGQRSFGTLSAGARREQRAAEPEQ